MSVVNFPISNIETVVNTQPIPDIYDTLPVPVSFTKIADAAQYKGSDYANSVRVERGITLEQAQEIAANDPEIDYFFIVKGGTMALEMSAKQAIDNDPLHLISEGGFVSDKGEYGHYMRVFHQGDVVFFKNEGKWLGSAPGLADVYVKN